VPYGFATLRLYLDGYIDGGGSLNVFYDRDTAGATTITMPAARAFTTAVDLDVARLRTVTVKIPMTEGTHVTGCSAYWVGRVLP
jgi:hypothetical protein